MVVESGNIAVMQRTRTGHPEKRGKLESGFAEPMGPLHPAEVLNGRFCSAHLAVRQRARAFAECPSGSERLEQAARCSTSSWQVSRRGNGTRAGGSGGIPWLAVVPPGR
jgi:hypothetical protein